MQASTIKLLDLLGDSKTIFKIPVYQRKYEWTKEQLEQFFLDIDRIIESDLKKEHFLGTIVYVQNEMPGLMKERIVIDGQQRITTTILLIKAIMDSAISSNLINSNVNPDEIQDTYLINRYGKEDNKYKLYPVESDLEAYKDLMENMESDSNIYRNYEICKKYIENSKYDFGKIYEALGLVNIVYISLNQDENPQIIFESLNSTGLSLTQADLIRNFVLMGLKYEEQKRLYLHYWIKIEKRLTNKVISDFIRDFLTMKEGKVSNQNKVYESFKNYFFNNNLTSEDILIDLLEYSEYYHMIINSNTNNMIVNENLDYINNIKNSVSYPYILKLFGDYYKQNLLDEDNLEKILSLIVSYIYRRNICNIATNALNKIFASMSKEVDNRIDNNFSYYDAVVDYLMSRKGTGIFPRDEEFKSNFLTSNLYNKSNSLSKTILYTLEKTTHKEVVNIEALSVEHIMPQTLTNEWNIDLGNNSYEIHRIYLNTIGNLTLTNYNSEISNKSFLDKKEYYKNSNINITRNIQKYDKWTDKEILDRGEILFETIKDVWIQPKDNYKSIADDILLPTEEYSINDNVIVTGYSPRIIIIDDEIYNVTSWKDMLIKSCRYLYDLDNEFFLSLRDNSKFSNILSFNEEDFRSPNHINGNLYMETNFSAKNILSYIVLFFREYDLNEYVYFQIK